MKKLPLFLLALCWSTCLWSQADLHSMYALDRIVIGLENAGDATTVQRALGNNGALLPFHEAALFKGGRCYIAWLDPQHADAPDSGLAVEQLLQGIRKLPGIAFAEPFLVGANGAKVGLTNELWCALGSGADPSAIAGDLKAREWEAVRHLSGWTRFVLPADRAQSAVELVSTAEALPGVEMAAPNMIYELDVHANDPQLFRQWALENKGTPIQGSGTPGADMSVTEAWTVTTGNPNIRIAIIDSGVDTAHADLKDNLRMGFDATGGGSGGFPNTTYASDGHGTACAGIAAAKGDNGIGIAGVCYDCSLVPIKLFTYIFNPFGDPLPFASGGDMASAIGWAWQDGEADVLSNSWGLTDPLLGALPDGTAIVEAALDLALDSARNGRGIPIFFSSGNEDNPPIWPGRRAGMISVNATSQCDERKSPASCDLQNWTGNWGDSLDIGAPGVAIASTDMSGGNGYDGTDYTPGFGGTSAACPNAAGVMGLILSVEPSLGLEEARALLETTCDKVGGYTYTPGSANGSWSPELGYGRVNAFAAVQAALAVSMPDAQVFAPLQLGISPQPAQDFIRVSYHLEQGGELSFEIVDLQGKSLGRLFEGKVAAGSYAQEFAISSFGLAEGFYVLKVKYNQKNFARKLLIGS